MPKISRRKLLRRGTEAVVAGGIALCGVPALEQRAFSKSVPQAEDYYQKLGVTPLINAAGTYTALSASTMPDEVQAAAPQLPPEEPREAGGAPVPVAPRGRAPNG